MPHPISAEAHDELQQWPARARRLFDELLEDAGSDLQRELILRAVAASHTPAEVHAFADELRGMSDADAYASCTLHEDAPDDYTMSQLLRAEADPLFAFELKGGIIDPNETAETFAPGLSKGRDFEAAVPVVDALTAALTKKSSDSFEADSPGSPKAMRLDVSPLSDDPPFLESLLADATRTLDISWKEQDVDRPSGLSLADALACAEGALARGIPVPCAIGPAPGDHRRFIVLMQLNTSGKVRAWQLYDPFTAELLWANENDLLARAELPFANKLNRRLTRIVLPQSLRSAF